MCRPAAAASTWWGPGGPGIPPRVRGRVGGEESAGVCVCVCVCVRVCSVCVAMDVGVSVFKYFFD